MVDPVNEEAVAAKRTDPDEIDFATVDLSGDKAGPAQRKLTLWRAKGRSGWVVSPSGVWCFAQAQRLFARRHRSRSLHDLAL